MKAEEYFKKEWGKGFIKATLSEPNGLLELSMEDIYNTMKSYKDHCINSISDEIKDEIKELENKLKADDLSFYGDGRLDSFKEFEKLLNK